MRTLIALSLMLSGVSFASTVDLQLATEPGQWSTLRTEIGAYGVRQAQDSVNYTQTIITDGPERPGFLQIQSDGSGYFDGGHSQITSGFTLNPFSGSGDYYPGGHPVTEIVCSPSGCTPGNAYFGPGYAGELIPVTLGVPLTLVSNGYAFNTPLNGYPTGGSMHASFQFRFLEPPFNIRDFGHNLQPVLATETPEPSTWGMLLVAAGLGILKLRKQWR